MIANLVQVNKDFYAKQNFGEDFSKTRSDYFWPSWQQVSEVIKKNLSENELEILDLGCGNGRFLDFWIKNNLGFKNYIGTDFSQILLDTAKEQFQKLGFNTTFLVNDFITEDIYLGDQKPNLVVLFGVMHHIFGSDFRVEILKKIKSILEHNGLIIFSTWQFSTAHTSKILDTNTQEAKTFFEKYAINSELLEPGDYFLRWKNQADIFRYCHLYNDMEVKTLLEKSGLALVDSFLEENKHENYNKYWVCKAKV